MAQSADGDDSARKFGRSLIRAGAAVLFTAILSIPKLRRLRRNVRAWSAVRAMALAAGAWMIWYGFHRHSLAAWLAAGIILIAFGALVRARPVRKSIDEASRELGALVVVNGGTLIDAVHLKPRPRVSIFVTPDRLIALSTADFARLEEIPVAGIKTIAVMQSPDGAAERVVTQPSWDLQITWDFGEISTRFRYDGGFAEHLARIAEKTLREVWKKPLPVIQA